MTVTEPDIADIGRLIEHDLPGSGWVIAVVTNGTFEARIQAEDGRVAYGLGGTELAALRRAYDRALDWTGASR
ncbi:MAG: hypothetical protein KGL39_43340 [Patescibacteria group bacterium]|nr:hypothetical protein [Patescibacteria group bacterium]